MLSVTDRIWNRACLCSEPAGREGDRALAAVLLLHGLAMNGGLLHSLGCLDEAQLESAINGFLYFGLSGVEPVLRYGAAEIAAGRETDALEAELDRRYAQFVPDDDALDEAFRRQWRDSPEAFAPLDADSD